MAGLPCRPNRSFLSLRPCIRDEEARSVEMKVVVIVEGRARTTRDLDETMCVDGLRVDSGHHEWARLHPVPFRDLDDESKFAKYQTVSVTVRRPKTDRRPETWAPIHGSILAAETIGPTTAGRGAGSLLSCWERPRCAT